MSVLCSAGCALVKRGERAGAGLINVGAAETTPPDVSRIQLHADTALNAMADAGLKPANIYGIATAGETPVTVAHYLGLTPKWVDGTTVGAARS
jgi:hypothetical protein